MISDPAFGYHRRPTTLVCHGRLPVDRPIAITFLAAWATVALCPQNPTVAQPRGKAIRGYTAAVIASRKASSSTAYASLASVKGACPAPGMTASWA